VHSFGWPADSQTYGGSFLYHLDGDRIAIGYVSGLDYQDPQLPAVRSLPAMEASSQREIRCSTAADPLGRRARHRHRRLAVAAEG
jgi:flavin-dependent dehydrogenase